MLPIGPNKPHGLFAESSVRVSHLNQALVAIRAVGRTFARNVRASVKYFLQHPTGQATKILVDGRFPSAEAMTAALARQRLWLHESDLDHPVVASVMHQLFKRYTQLSADNTELYSQVDPCLPLKEATEAQAQDPTVLLASWSSNVGKCLAKLDQ